MPNQTKPEQSKENSSSQSQRRKNLYLQEAEGANSTDRVLIHAAFTTLSLLSCMMQVDAEKKKLWDMIVDQVSRWRAAVGATKNVSGDAIRTDCGFLIDTFPGLTIGELKLAIDLYIKKGLPTESYYNFTNFHPAYMSEVIRAFMKFKFERLKNIVARVESKMSEPEPPTPFEEVESMRWMINEIQTQVNLGRQVIVFIGDVYKFLVRTKRVKVNDRSKELVHYVHKRISQFSNTVTTGKTKSIGEIINTAGMKPGTVHTRADIFQMEYWVLSWMKKEPLKKLLKEITVKDFS